MQMSAASYTRAYFNPSLTLIRVSFDLSEKSLRKGVITLSTKSVPECLRGLSINYPLRELLSAQSVHRWVRTFRQLGVVQCCFYVQGPKGLGRRFNVSSRVSTIATTSVTLSTIS